MIDEAIVLSDGTQIGPEELEYRFSRSGGPGGQNVNKVATKVELRFRPATSNSFTPRQKELIASHLGHRIRKNGDIVITSQRHRRQSQNRRECQKKLIHLLDEAFSTKKARIPTRPTRASRVKRLDKKRQRGQKKDLRRPPRRDD